MTISRIKTNSIEDSAVTGAKVATGGIATVDMADGSVTSLQIADGGISAVDIANSAITPAKLSTDAQYTGFKNRIINGAMMIDQRNAGASVTPANGGFGVDRWKATLTQASKFSMQQSSVAPSGFVNSLLITSLSAYSVLTGDAFDVEQPIEAFNVSDLGWGASGAQTVTVSFWVRSSLTGTFGGALLNSAANYSYPFSYTINAANTWELKTVTISGPTAGTWASGNSTGISVRFSLGCGATYSGTAGSWSANTYIQPTGATSVVGTNGATFYITGVQLEKGSSATSFDYRPYGTELALCQRYYEKSYDIGVTPGSVDEITADWGVASSDTSLFLTGNKFKVTKRASPTMTFYNTATGASGSFVAGATTMTVSAYSGGTTSCARLYSTAGHGTIGVYSRWHWTASSEL